MKEFTAANLGKHGISSLHGNAAGSAKTKLQPNANIDRSNGLSLQRECLGWRTSLASLSAKLPSAPPLAAPSAGLPLQRSLALPVRGVQAKLVVGPADDEYEREADRVAEQAVSMPDASVQRQADDEEEEEKIQPKPLAGQIRPLIQRQSEPEEEEEEIQAKPLVHQITPLIQKQSEPEEEEEEPVQAKRPDGLVRRQEGREEDEETLQAKSLIQRMGSKGGDAGPDLEQSLAQARGSGRSLEGGVRGRMERSFGVDFGSVRIHSDAHADGLNRSIQARAFTTGQDVFLRQGEYRPGSSEGQRLLAHELTHVVQQNGGEVQRAQGLVKPTGEVSGSPLNDSRTLESEADSVGQKALQKYVQVEKTEEDKSSAAANSVAQKKSIKQSLGFLDNPLEAIQLRKLQSIPVNNTAQRQPIQRIANYSTLEEPMIRMSDYGGDTKAVVQRNKKGAAVGAVAGAGIGALGLFAGPIVGGITTAIGAGIGGVVGHFATKKDVATIARNALNVDNNDYR
ncbi:MAG: DUF4157 domain-containing protein [Methanothrix sp.]|nr:DUF4157 domain-containing protein [Methanothrix sp.]